MHRRRIFFLKIILLAGCEELIPITAFVRIIHEMAVAADEDDFLIHAEIALRFQLAEKIAGEDIGDEQSGSPFRSVQRSRETENGRRDNSPVPHLNRGECNFPGTQTVGQEDIVVQSCSVQVFSSAMA